MAERNVIDLSLCLIEKPKIKHEKDDINGGVREVTTFSFSVVNMPKGMQFELANQALSERQGIADIRITLLEPTFYKAGMLMDTETGEIKEDVRESTEIS